MDTSTLTTADRDLLKRLQNRLSFGELPGRAAQKTMVPPMRGKYADPPADARRASVLILFYPLNDALHLLYIQRTSPTHDRHAGQISFPGGSVEADDRDAVHTALREAEEEVGIVPERVEVLGELSQLYIPVSNFLVDPIVGYLSEAPAFTLQESEVARVLQLPVADFLTDGVVQTGKRQLANGLSIPDVPFWAVRGEEVWGATAMITAELVALLD